MRICILLLCLRPRVGFPSIPNQLPRMRFFSSTRLSLWSLDCLARILTKPYRYAVVVVVLLSMDRTDFPNSSLQAGFNLGVDPRKPGQNMRGFISLPHGSGKKVRIAVLTKGDKVGCLFFRQIDFWSSLGLDVSPPMFLNRLPRQKQQGQI